MLSLFHSSPSSTHAPRTLSDVVRSVRVRWRLRVALHGLAITAGAGLAVFLFSAYGLDAFRFSGTAIAVFRVIAYGSIAALAIRFLIVPLSRRVSDEQVALYLEEHEPSLRGVVLGAVEFGGDAPPTDRPAVSRQLVERLVERAVEECARIDYGTRVERPRLKRLSGALTGVTVLSAALFLLQPGFVAHSAPFLLTPWSAGGGDSPYAIAVHPGDTVLARGADLEITAELRNFTAERVEIAMRRGSSTDWERWPMTEEDEGGSFDFLAFNIDSVTEYLVEAGGVRSAIHRIEVVDLPYVDRIDLEYHFPSYTGLSPRTEEDGGDIAAVAGTEVTLTVIPTMLVAGGALVIDERDTIALAPDTNVLAGTLTVERAGSYRVLLQSEHGALVVGSPDYYIDVLVDQPPTLRFTAPGRDISVTSIDEVFVEVTAEDDYGVGRIELQYSVNGGQEQAVTLYRGTRTPPRLTAGHTFYLEEIDLEPGDFLSYYARATDANRVGGAQTATTDIYFVEIRPFDRRYRQAEAQGGEGGGGGGGDVGELSSRQRQIVAATFKIVRDSTELSPDEVRENLATLALAQGRLREEVQTLVDRMESRRVVQLDSTFRAVAEALPHAVVAMQEAEEQLGQRRAQDALSPEQRALQYLQRAEAAFREREISRGGGQQGGGGGQSASAEDLADLFDLEMDKLRNQYEQVDRGERRETSQQVDEILEKLRELARRQQQENERMRAQMQNQGGSGGSAAQRRLAEETEEAARRLERLSREQSRPDLEQTARRLREAAEAMRRAAAARNADGAARGQSALDELRDARRRLEQSRSAGRENEIRDALRRAERLSAQQQDVRREVDRLDDAGPARNERVRRLVDRKNEMADEVRDLEAQLTELARAMREEQPDAARRLNETAREARDQRLADKILFSRGVVQERSTDYARNFEEQIGADLDSLEQGIRDALDAVGESREQRLGRSLDRARDLVNALESLDERLRAATEPQGSERQEPASPQPGQETAEAQGGEQPGRQPSSPQGMPRGGGTGQLLPDDVRQFRGELGRRRNELAELRRDLVEEDVDVSQLDRILRGLGTLQNRGTLGDPRGLEQLQQEIIAGLKDFEFSLRRDLAGSDQERLFLSGSDDVPEAYRKLVEEYYKALSRNRR